MAKCALFRHGQPKGYEGNKNGQSLQEQNTNAQRQVLTAWEEYRRTKIFGVSVIRRTVYEFDDTKVELQ